MKDEYTAGIQELLQGAGFSTNLREARDQTVVFRRRDKLGYTWVWGVRGFEFVNDEMTVYLNTRGTAGTPSDKVTTLTYHKLKGWLLILSPRETAGVEVHVI